MGNRSDDPLSHKWNPATELHLTPHLYQRVQMLTKLKCWQYLLKWPIIITMHAFKQQRIYHMSDMPYNRIKNVLSVSLNKTYQCVCIYCVSKCLDVCNHTNFWIYVSSHVHSYWKIIFSFGIKKKEKEKKSSKLRMITHCAMSCQINPSL